MYFHNGNHIETLTFHNNDCNQEFVYVSNMSKDHYLYNENPYLLVTSNGIILGMDQRVQSLNLYNSDHALVESYSFNYLTTCDSSSINELVEVEVKSFQHTSTVFSFLLILLFAYVMIIKTKGNHHEN